MKKVLLELVVLIYCTGLVWAQDGTEPYKEVIVAPTKEPTSTNDTGFFKDTRVSIINTIASRYWGSIVGGIFYTGGPVNFTDFRVELDDKIGTTYFFIGMINPLDTLKYDHNGGTEYYGAVGKTINLWKSGEKNLPAVRLNGMVLYDAISKIKYWDDDVIQFYLRAEFPRVPVVQPYVEGYHWEQSGRKAPPVGNFGRAGLHRQQPMGVTFQGAEMELGMDVSIGYSSEGLFGTSSGLAYYRGILSTEFKVNKHLSIVPAIIGQLPGNQEPIAFVDRARLFYNLTVRWDF